MVLTRSYFFLLFLWWSMMLIYHEFYEDCISSGRISSIFNLPVFVIELNKKNYTSNEDPWRIIVCCFAASKKWSVRECLFEGQVWESEWNGKEEKERTGMKKGKETRVGCLKEKKLQRRGLGIITSFPYIVIPSTPTLFSHLSFFFLLLFFPPFLLYNFPHQLSPSYWPSSIQV